MGVGEGIKSSGLLTLPFFQSITTGTSLVSKKKKSPFCSESAVMKWNLHSASITSGQRKSLSPSKIVHFKSSASSTAIYLILIKVLS